MTKRTNGRATAAEVSTKLAVERTRLAYERTMLSWVRTATALITFGFSVEQFSRFARGANAEKPDFIGPHEFGLAMIVIGLVALLLATLGHRSAIQALKLQSSEQYPAISLSRAGVLAALVSILGLLALLSMFLRQ